MVGLLFAGASVAEAETLRLWPTAVVVDDSIRLGDLCEITDAAPEAEGTLTALMVTDAPPPGGSRLITLDTVREVLAASGANMGTVTVRGAKECAVSRPAAPTQPQPLPVAAGSQTPRSPAGGRSAEAGPAKPRWRAEAPSRGDGLVDGKVAPAAVPGAGRTLRQAVIDFFSAELARYHGTAELTFDRTSEQVLALCGPAFEFKIQRRGGAALGLTPIEVEVVSKGQVVQTVPMVVQTAMRRQVVTARRAINQDAAVRDEDVALTTVTFARLEHLGLDDAAQVIGQRAKRYIPAGAQIEAEMLETVPLVQRGELVTLTTAVGGIHVVTTAKAEGSGVLGESIKVRSAENKRIEFDAVVVGPARVAVTGDAGTSAAPMLALGGKP
ncbi:MAG: flagellar basal body P-ring formation protein FlgA [Planctomycetes bacterium]|nr:flagellar basal body P-ring formation protein FlgA [Planctomycetota bacterium]